MKKFEVPELEVVTLSAEDIITGSGDCAPDCDIYNYACPFEGLGEDDTPIT